MAVAMAVAVAVGVVERESGGVLFVCAPVVDVKNYLRFRAIFIIECEDGWMGPALAIYWVRLVIVVVMMTW